MQEKTKAGILYLIPTPLSGQTVDQALTASCKDIIYNLDYFIVENAKTARAFLKEVGTAITLQQLHLDELNEHTPTSRIDELLSPIITGRSCGLLSETGVPCLADPGSNLVASAHQKGITVLPLVGPSSILLAIISSGLSGQNFSFCGYLPAKSPEREIRIRELEKLSKINKQSQFFIETPYRAQKIFQALLDVCNDNTKISLGINCGSVDANSAMKSVASWKRQIPVLDGKLVVFGMEA